MAIIDEDIGRLYGRLWRDRWVGVTVHVGVVVAVVGVAAMSGYKADDIVGAAMQALVIIVLVTAMGMVGRMIGQGKGRASEGFWLGALLFVLGWIIVAVMPSTVQAEAGRQAAVEQAKGATGKRKFRVRGCHRQTGKDLSVIVPAADPLAAEEEACRMGLMVESVELLA